MKVLFAMTHIYFWIPLDPVARHLHADGHTVKVLIDKMRNQKFENKFLFDHDPAIYSMGWMTSLSGKKRSILQAVREIINYIAYLKVRQPTSPLLTQRWAVYMPRFMQWLVKNKAFRNFLRSDFVWNLLHHFEMIVSPDSKIVNEIREFEPDVVVTASAIMPFSKELEYLKAAKSLGIPTVVIIPSWDNLTTKGTLQIIPDWLFVWNQGQVAEAVKLHEVPERQIYCTGAPRFDPWFAIHPELDREVFCRQAGIEHKKPYLLYICSSEFIAGDETKFIDDFVDALMAKDPAMRNLNIMVRPHPLNIKIWENYIAKHGNVVIWPNDLSVVDQSHTNQDFYHSLKYCEAVVGINTSAFIEAAVMGKPCIAIASHQYELTQLGIPHFKHLLDAGFLELPRDFSEAARVIQELLNGKDGLKDRRDAFVHNFIRPHGIDIPAAQVMGEAIENVMCGRHPGANAVGVVL